MPAKDQDLDRLKGEVLDYLRAAGLPIYYCFGMPGEDGFAYWDTEQHPDWRQFTDVAREAGARMFLFSSRELADEELTGARETLGEAAGILMERDKVSARRAQQILRQASQRLNLDLGDVAQTLIDTVDRPEATPPERDRPGSFEPGSSRHRSRAE